MSSPFFSLHRLKPFSFPCPRILLSWNSTSNSMLGSVPVSIIHVRNASVSPCMIRSAPPPPPLTSEQVQQQQLLQKMRRQQNNQPQIHLRLESAQRLRQQQELQHILASDRAMTRQKRALDRWQSFLEARVEHRQRQDVRKALHLEQRQLAERKLENIERGLVNQDDRYQGSETRLFKT